MSTDFQNPRASARGAVKTMNLQGAIETVRQTIVTIGPATARQVETHPDVVKACRSSKTKARRHIERLVQLGHVKSDGARVAVFWVG